MTVHSNAPGTCGLVAMTSAQHAEGRQFEPGQVYFHRFHRDGEQRCHAFRASPAHPCPMHAQCAKMTRPGLEPGISGSGGRRLIH